MNEFQGLGLAETITRALAEEGYSAPTPIQAQAVPAALAGRDVIGIAQTGTGKTAAFALPILHRLAQTSARPVPKSARILVVCPTRELGGQIVDAFQAYGRHVGVSVALAIGGVPMGKQRRTLAGGVDVLVATPGRLLDLTGSGAVHLRNVEVLVLDEADRMLDMGFIRDIRKIVALVPAKRQTLFFSATMAPEIARLAADMLDEPVRVEVTPAATTVERIDQRAIRVERAGKPARLVAILRDQAIDRALVFTRTKHGADRVVRGLVAAGIAAEAIHGNKTQGNRERTMAAFRSGEIRTLVATDIAARGIDVDGVSHVVNFDLPNIAETYVHRIGRTARAGAEGVAISLVSGEDAPFLRAIEKLIRRTIPMEGEAPRAVATAGQPQEPREARDDGRRPGRNKRRRNRKPGGSRDGNNGDKHVQAQRAGRSGRASNGPSPQSRPGDGIAAVGFMSRAPRDRGAPAGR